MPRFSLTPLRTLRPAARPTAARFAAVKPQHLASLHSSARLDKAAPDVVKPAQAPALDTTGQPTTDPMTGEVIKAADIDVSLPVLVVFSDEYVGKRRPAVESLCLHLFSAVQMVTRLDWMLHAHEAQLDGNGGSCRVATRA